LEQGALLGVADMVADSQTPLNASASCASSLAVLAVEIFAKSSCCSVFMRCFLMALGDCRVDCVVLT
jgi:hypothetical protein